MVDKPKNTSSMSTGFTTSNYREDRLGRDNSQAVLDYYIENEGSAPAFEYARDLVIGSYSDWYIPTEWEIRQANNVLVNSYSSSLDFLWTSTEQTTGTSNAYARIYTTNNTSFFAKNKTLTEGKQR